MPDIIRAPGTGAGGGAATTLPFVTIGNDGTLSAERALTAGTGISITDNGADSTVVISATGGATSLVRPFLLMGA